jgi:predicted ATP-dependent serine protease
MSQEKERQYVCRDCGNEQDSMYRPCDACKSSAVVSIAVVVRIFGVNWKEKCFGGEKN